ncbi:MAG TPA: FkbM family methyltransferase [Bryobacteraceae bacterium]|nr:FkbM family methyltransferase [Bryobacteraceae bacterium]
MSISKRQESLLTGIYALGRKSGFLNTAPGQWAFSRAYFLYKRLLEDPHAGLLRRFPELLRGGNVLDVGANIGYTAHLFSHAIDPEFKVYAFEPDEYNFRLLDRLADSSRVRSRIQAIQSAVGDADGSAELSINPRHHGDHRILPSASSNTVRVPLVTLDTFVANRQLPFPVRFIKVDVQGYEPAVCRGMERTLAQNPRAVVALEYMPQALREMGFEPRELLRWIAEKQFCVHVMGDNGALQMAAADRLPADGYVDLLLAHDKLIPETNSKR